MAENSTYSKSFCHCFANRPENASSSLPADVPLACICGEISHSPVWGWSDIHKTTTSYVHEGGQQVTFHDQFIKGYSTGNACVRGDTPFVANNHYFWELKLVTRVFGTSVMIGVGTKNVVLDKFAYNFCHFLGEDDESWGLSYDGTLLHNKEILRYHHQAGFSEGSIVGVHLDMWNGTLEYFLNREPLGIAFRGLRSKTLFPIVSATAAKLSVKLIYSIIRPHSLTFLLLQSLMPGEVEKFPHGLKREIQQCWWQFPKSSKKEMKRNYMEDPSMCTIVFYVHGDSEDGENEDQRALHKRMKRVVENSSYRRANSNICYQKLDESH